MSILEGVLKEELERIKKNINSYELVLEDLPKGYIFNQKVNGRLYCYRKRREGDKIVSIYIGPAESDEAKKALIDYLERKRIESNLRSLRIEKDRLLKALRHYGG